MINLKNLFGNYKGNNINRLIELIKKVDKQVEPYFNFKKPFFKGKYKLSFYEYLKSCELNNEPLDSEAVFKYIAPLFQNMPNWNNPGTMINAIPPVNLVGLASSTYSNIYNPNMVQDTFCGLLILTEMEVAKYISKLVGWEWEKSFGIFTSGGFQTNLYPTKIAISKACPEGNTVGYDKGKYFMVTSSKAHPCHREIFGLVGLGTKNCILLPCTNEDKIDIAKAENIISQNIEEGRVFVGFNMNGGSTAEYTVDPIEKIFTLRQKLKTKYSLNYTPHIHVDAVLGWVWLFFKGYNFEENKLNFSEEIIRKIKSMTGKVGELKFADSFGVDFHKTGFCPYMSSLFIVQNKNDVYRLSKSNEVPLKDLEFGNYSPFETTFEYSRSVSGPLSALATLKSLGTEGFQSIIGNLIQMTEKFRDLLNGSASVEIVNYETEGIATLFILKPKQFTKNSLSELLKLPLHNLNEIKNYNVNFAKYVLECNKNEKISFTFTSSRSYEIIGTKIKLGAIKAYPMSVYLNETNMQMIVNEIIQTIEEYEKNGFKQSFSKFSNDALDPTWH